MTETMVKTEVQGRVAILTLNRPKALNALSDALIEELYAAMLAFDNDENIGAMVLTGNEKAFAAGADITAMQDFTYEDVYKRSEERRVGKELRSQCAAYE